MEYWQGKKVVITGGSGFVGSHLTKKLVDLGAKVEVLDLNISRPIITGAVFHLSDARSYKDCLSVFAEADVVFNLAAKVAGVEYNQKNHLKMLAENMLLLTVPVMAADKLSIPSFLQMSSVCVYADGETSPCNDNVMVDEMGPPNKANYGYAMAKRFGEAIALQSNNIDKMIIARPTNIYGPGDDFGSDSHVIPALIKKCIGDREIIVNGTGQEVREFVFVEDVVMSMLHLIEYRDGGIYNVGTSGTTAVTIAELVEIIQKISGMEHKKVTFRQGFDSGDNKRFTDCAKLEKKWFAEVTMLEEGLKRTIQWWEGKA